LALILVLVGVCLLEYLALQQKGKQIAQLTADVVAAEDKRTADGSLYKGKLAQSDLKVASLRQERDTSLAAQKAFADKLATAEQKSSAVLASKLAAAEEKLVATEKEVKEATVKAGSCQQQFNSLNAEYATMKQGLANLGLTGKTVDEKKNPGTITEGALDPRGGMEAALVLKESSQQPWDHGTSSKHQKAGGEGANASSLKSVQPHILSSNESGKAAVAGQEQPLLKAAAAVTR